MNEQQTDPKIYNGEVVAEYTPSWQALETVVNGWIRLSQHNKDLEYYQKLKEYYQ